MKFPMPKEKKYPKPPKEKAPPKLGRPRKGGKAVHPATDKATHDWKSIIKNL